MIFKRSWSRRLLDIDDYRARYAGFGGVPIADASAISSRRELMARRRDFFCRFLALSSADAIS